MMFYYRSSINKEDMITIWQNRLTERLHLTESLLLMKNSNAGTVYRFFRYVSLFRFLIIHFCQITLASFPIKVKSRGVAEFYIRSGYSPTKVTRVLVVPCRGLNLWIGTA